MSSCCDIPDNISNDEHPNFNAYRNNKRRSLVEINE